jgi:hypothetical protein
MCQPLTDYCWQGDPNDPAGQFKPVNQGHRPGDEGRGGIIF